MNRFRMLAIDGGGMKGLFSAAFLAEIENRIDGHVVDYFDLIAGTSTGGIIALGLALGFPAQQLVEFYLERGSEIFPTSGPLSRSWVRLKALFGPRYDARHAERVLRELVGEARLGDACTRLVIPAFNHATGDIHLFKTAHHARLTADYKCRAWEVARATSSAPTYFHSQRIGLHTDLLDGGIWANNPAMVAVTEAMGLLRIPPENVALLSIGTTLSRSPVIASATGQRGGILRWARPSASLFMHLQTVVAHHQAGHMLEQGRYVRIDPATTHLNIGLDDCRDIGRLVSFGEQAARHAYPSLTPSFFGGKRDPFVPIYP